MQVLKAALYLLGSMTCYVAVWFFFRYGLAFVFGNLRWPAEYVPWLSLVAMAAVTWGGWKHWLNGQNWKTYHESPFYHDLGDASGGAVMMDHYGRQVTGPAYVLSQIFLAGPVFLFRAVRHLRMRLPVTPGLKARLESTLQKLRSIGKWQPITEHPECHQEILMLAQMRRIDSSGHTGILRIKASPSSDHGI